MKTYKEGDLVRISGRTHRKACGHSIPQGAVCRVLGYNSLGNVDVAHPERGYTQGVGESCLKLAKQAMKKHDLYAARR